MFPAFWQRQISEEKQIYQKSFKLQLRLPETHRRTSIYTVITMLDRRCIVGSYIKYTAVSTKVVPRKCKSVRDNADWHYG